MTLKVPDADAVLLIFELSTWLDLYKKVIGVPI